MYALEDEILRRGHEVDTQYLGWIRKPLQIKPQLRALREYARKYEVSHGQYGSGCGFVTSRMEGRKLLTLRGSDWHRLEKGNASELLHNRFSRFLTERALRDICNVVVVSNRMRQEISGLFPTTTIDVIPDGVDLRLFHPVPRENARRSLNIPMDEKVVLFATNAAHRPVKRESLARESVRLAQERDRSIRLIELATIPHEEVPLYINAAEAVLLTSQHEGWPNIIKEALACNKPFVASNVGDLTDITRRARSCRVVEGDNPQDYADALLEVIATEPEPLRDLVADLSVERVAQRLIDVYEKIL